MQRSALYLNSDSVSTKHSTSCTVLIFDLYSTRTFVLYQSYNAVQFLYIYFILHQGIILISPGKYFAEI